MSDLSVQTKQALEQSAKLLAELELLANDLSPSAQRRVDEIAAELLCIPAEPGNECLVDALLAVHKIWYLNNRNDDLVPYARKANERAQSVGDLSSRHKGLRGLALALGESGDYVGAIETNVQILGLPNCANAHVPAWVNLSRSLICLGHLRVATGCLRAGEKVTDDPIFLGTIRVNLAHALREIGDIPEAVRMAESACQLISHDADSSYITFRATAARAALAEALLSAKAISSARDAVREARAIHEIKPTPYGEDVVLRVEGLVAIHEGDVDAGLAKLQESLQLARRERPADLDSALASCVEGCEAAGRQDEALRYLHELLAVQRDRGAVRLLAAVDAAVATASDGLPDLDSLRSVKAIELESTVGSQLTALIAAAASATQQSGHDRFHIFRVARLAELFAKHLGWTSERAEALALACQLMDLGMTAIPKQILQKTRGLSSGEWAILHQHAQFGADLLVQARLAILQPCAPVARFHHERWDGTGPWRMTGEEIPIEARIANLCVSFDSLVHDRPWRQAMQLPAALHLIEREAGQRFDPHLAIGFASFIRTLYWEHDDFEGFLAEKAVNNSYVRALDLIDRLLRAADSGTAH